jgi:hypothetical protein
MLLAKWVDAGLPNRYNLRPNDLPPTTRGWRARSRSRSRRSQGADRCFAILEVDSLAEAVEHARKFALLVGSERVDVRRVVEAEDLQ